MSTRIRLRRMGANKRPFYRVVVADQRSPRDGRFIENIGKYHPLEDPSLIDIDEGRALHWLRVGAQPSDQVRNLMVKVGIWEKFVTERPAAADQVKQRAEKPDKPKLSKKAAAKAAAAAEEPVASSPSEDADVSAVAEDASAPAEEAADAPPDEPVSSDETPEADQAPEAPEAPEADQAPEA
jgi:small subunit ribosomal protein S16